MPQTLSTRSERKRQQIMEAAGQLFVHQGFITTSMDEIAQHAGVSKQTVYAHFGSKDELFTHCVEQKCATNDLLPTGLSGDNPRQVLLEFMLRFAEMINSDEAIYVYRLCVSQAETHSDLSQRYYEAGPAKVIGAVGDYLATLAAKGILQMDDPMLAAEQLLLMGRGAGNMRRALGLPVDETEAECRHRIAQTVDLFLRGYGFRE
ncbi:TetR/AcrR family transcriptional regulator [Ferrimonas balearica]|uniref:TetR/AcrR family transcriptional regulator n=1 Tax=Ferrimonas balearica TaxID=44012 RepID=UPI001C99493F|nr:TetR/AcrR family transcriptional regulator [Ferrimonas balearica]MBY5922061.1 TetR/AcrR family transcriptional regulator [Ferrimonas balearica]MBY5994599.1 TetR/AcrR family transcriptional regulator [Ferrimonas balearica]